MQLLTISVADCLPAPYNPRKPLRPGSAGWRRLERSLHEFELVQPIVWNRRTRHIVGGHQRLEILKHQGLTEVEVVVVDLPLDREKALNIALNNRQVGSDWDPGKLVALVAELTDLPDFDATLTGFDPADLRRLVLTPDAPVEETTDDDSHVVATLRISPAAWPTLRPELDALLQRHPIELHLQLPTQP